MPNECSVDNLVEWALNATSEPNSWQSLIDRARELLPLLLLADAIYLDARLAREPLRNRLAIEPWNCSASQLIHGEPQS